MDCLIYARVSTEKQSREDKVSISEQLEACRKLAREAGLAVVAEIVDKDRYKSENGRMVQPSGTRLDRPGFVRLLELVKAKRVKVIVAWAQDRLGRGGSTISVFRDAVESAGCEVRFASGQWDAETSELLGAVSGIELRRIKARSRLGKIGNLKRGLHMGPAPYGYKASRNELGDRIDYEIVPSEAKILRQMLKLYCQHYTYRKIAESIPDGRSGAWHPKTIRGILQNAFYTGVIHWSGQRAKGRHALIYSEAEIRALRREHAWREEHRVDRPRDHEYVYPLSGILYCGYCGNRLVSHRQSMKSNGKRYAEYYCWRSHPQRRLDPSHPPNSISEIKALKQIAGIIGSLTDDEIETALTEIERPAPIAAEAVEVLRVRELELRAALEQLRGLGIASATRPIEAELDRVVAELDESGAITAQGAKSDNGQRIELLKQTRDFFASGAWQADDPAKVRQILTDSVGELVLKQGVLVLGGRRR